jgi:hypothetical protein
VVASVSTQQVSSTVLRRAARWCVDYGAPHEALSRWVADGEQSMMVEKIATGEISSSILLSLYK